MEIEKVMIKVGNWFTTLLLNSPLHGLVSGIIVLLTIVGKNSGKVFSTPVNYVQVGSDLLIISLHSRKWWRNLRAGCPVTLHLRGEIVQGEATVMEKQADVVNGLKVLLAKASKYAKYLHVAVGPDGEWDPAGLDHAACSKVLVKITIPVEKVME